MPLTKTMLTLPGHGLDWSRQSRVLSALHTSDDWYLHALIAPVGSAPVDDRPWFAPGGLSWEPSGIWLRAEHDGPPLGASAEIWESAAGVHALFLINDDRAVRDAVLSAVRAGASVSAGIDPLGVDEAGNVRGTIGEASLTPEPAFPDAVILGLFTPETIVYLEASGLRERPGPAAGALFVGRQLLAPLLEMPPADALALLDSLPTNNPTPDLVAEARAAIAAQLRLEDRRYRAGMLETITTPLALEMRSASGSHFLECRCVPYDVVSNRTGGHPERFVRGAFADADPSAVKLRDNNHDMTGRPVGIAEHLEERPDGLYGAFRLFRTPEGRSALDNVREGTYGGVSVGFRAVDDAVIGGIREIRSATLDHVSLVDEPAYIGADILGVA